MINTEIVDLREEAIKVSYYAGKDHGDRIKSVLESTELEVLEELKQSMIGYINEMKQLRQSQKLQKDVIELLKKRLIAGRNSAIETTLFD